MSVKRQEPGTEKPRLAKRFAEASAGIMKAFRGVKGMEAVELGQHVVKTAMDSIPSGEKMWTAILMAFPAVDVKNMPQIETLRVVLVPMLHPDSVYLLQYRILASVEARILFSHFTNSLGDLEAHLHSHRPLGQGPYQRFKSVFRSIPPFVVVIVRIETVKFVARDETTIQLHGYAVEVIPNRQQLTERRSTQGLLVLGHGGRHYLMYSLVSSRSRSRPQ